MQFPNVFLMRIPIHVVICTEICLIILCTEYSDAILYLLTPLIPSFVELSLCWRRGLLGYTVYVLANARVLGHEWQN